ncbi:hypothetical protein LTR91_018840 [Friedmanniomyces endolithicus]|uniref:Carboxylic ester hydrolase n=1 Tax=Friedmanniomyces endolithicus TaxID=329885 RepID=A0AAN6HCJ0_9PEZI|nr:hypothetical protein LTR57_025167 [Friedmanniomyces endolithicus]KAK0959947.1 hypothetical protein LTS01_021165 [Friedmanniomyces endolithicus]KAK0963666.1 hypothetical protein LTR91_018840 [Friedmanniomyces endolithicus]KAK1021660.1 hypothetical protein LTS16_026344 [Friedmanniomyces endolithicus]
MKSFFAAALLGGAAYAAPTWPTNYGPPSGYGSGAPSATVKNGTVTGVHSSAYNQDFFLGVPYAQPPVGDLRFRNPQSINATYGTHAATAYAPICVGYGGDDIGYETSEDCLYLNVIRPAGYENESLPVGVWIHGGGLVMGGTADKRYNLSFIVENSVNIGKPIIGVSVAYRLSTWGFIASEEVRGSGQTNIGLRDQRLSLHWLQENIAAFGGDPSKVTIWGESAGAGSVGWQLTAYNGRDDGIFRAGIMESGNPVNYNSYRDTETWQPLYNSLVNVTNCTYAIDTLDCLRHLPFAILSNALNGTALSSFVPVLDGDFIQRFASIQLAEGDFVKVPIIDGANTDEGTAFGPRGINTTAEFIAYASSNQTGAFLGAQYATAIPAEYPSACQDLIPPPTELPCNYTYPASAGALYRRTAAYGGDVVMIANRRGACEAWAAHGVPAYSYRFNTIPAGLPPSVGVTHFQEVAFVFDNIHGYGYDAAHGTINPFTNKSASYIDLAKLMSSSWASFIHDLNPNNFTGRHAGSPDWPEYGMGAENIVFDANVTELVFAEPDTFRAEGIQWILDHALAYHR